MEYNRIIQGNNIEELPNIPRGAINCIVTSPPYWGLRDYGNKPQIWDGDKNCEHDFNEYNSKLLHKNRQNLNGGTLGNPGYRKNLHGFGNAKAGFCYKCGAWRGNFGLEPTVDLYIKHLCDIFDEAKEVLRDDGTCWVNIGDTYASGPKGNKTKSGLQSENYGIGKDIPMKKNIDWKNQNIPKKSLCMIPQRFAIEMINRGWILRNTIIWHKPNCMPESAKDRFTVDFEYIYFFAKSNKTIFWTNEKTLRCVGIRPPGTKGIEGEDWEYRTCPKCQGSGTITEEVSEEEAKKVCLRCEGSGEIKYSFWRGHDYWFEQQFDEYAPDTIPRRNRGLNVNKWTKGADGQTPHNLSQPRPNKNRGYKTKNPEIEVGRPQHHGSDISQDGRGRNRRTVWTIPTKSFPGAHFAVFPDTLIEPIIQAGCPRYICKKCKLARVKILDRDTDILKIKRNKRDGDGDRAVGGVYQKFMEDNPLGFKGYTDCECNAGFEPGVTLDLFMGAGTTGVEAKKQGKRYLGIEIKEEYINMANKRINKVPETLF